MKIVTNADDFGMNEDVNASVIAALEKGNLTSATIMPKMPGTETAISYARHRTDLSFGVHLTYVRDTVESPVSDPDLVPALVGPGGGFRASNQVRLRALRLAIPVAEIAKETEAQVRLLADRGIRISHVDSHGHLHKFRPFRLALRQVLGPLGIRRVRIPQNVYLKRPLKSPNFWLGPLWERAIRRSFRSTDYFYMPSSAGDRGWHGPLLGKIARLQGATMEVGVHPGAKEAWRQDEASELELFVERAMAEGHRLIGWSDVS